MAMERPTRLDGQGYVSETLVRAVEVNVGQDVGGRVFAVTHEAADRYRRGTASDVGTSPPPRSCVTPRSAATSIPCRSGTGFARVRPSSSATAGGIATNIVAEVLLTDGRPLGQRSRTHQGSPWRRAAGAPSLRLSAGKRRTRTGS